MSWRGGAVTEGWQWRDVDVGVVVTRCGAGYIWGWWRCVGGVGGELVVVVWS